MNINIGSILFSKCGILLWYVLCLLRLLSEHTGSIGSVDYFASPLFATGHGGRAVMLVWKWCTGPRCSDTACAFIYIPQVAYEVVVKGLDED